MSLPKALALEIVTPDQPIVRETVDEVVLPATKGELGVLPGHTPLLTTLTIGALWYRQGDQKHYVAVALGFAEVLPDRVTVLARMAERAERIDVAQAESARQRAAERLAHPGPDTDSELARQSLAKATVRLQVAATSHAKKA
jgi:F-type H+-transporting ATPase subunit epsilon